MTNTGTGNTVQDFLLVQSTGDCFEGSDIPTSEVHFISVYEFIKSYKTVNLRSDFSGGKNPCCVYVRLFVCVRYEVLRVTVMSSGI
jgi:hypothetical protein